MDTNMFDYSIVHDEDKLFQQRIAYINEQISKNIEYQEKEKRATRKAIIVAILSYLIGCAIVFCIIHFVIGDPIKTFMDLIIKKRMERSLRFVR